MRTSYYRFPIFISSTHYDLIDLRAELSSHLSSLGYDPIVSSEAGFPDNTPKLAPWESCLPVLSTCFMMILIIDSKYGAKLEWKHYDEICKNEKISPTHAEYRFAHSKRIRMIVFIRKEIMAHYQSYKRLRDEGKTDTGTRELLNKTLPKRINFETLQFISEVKRITPIPWIKEFDDVTEVKREVQSKLTNELAEVFLLRKKHKETLIKKLNEFLESKTNPEKVEILNELDIKSDLLEQIKSEKIKTKELEQQLESLRVDEEEKSQQLKQQIEDQRREIQRLIDECGNYELVPSDVTGVEYSHIIDEYCQHCGCCGSYDCQDISKGEIQNCSNCGSLVCIYCLKGGTLCPKCTNNE